MATSESIRRANFAFPYSERHEFYSPRTVRLLIGLSLLLIIFLVLTPFYLGTLRQQKLTERTQLTTALSATRDLATQARPATLQMARVDSIKQAIEALLNLHAEVRRTEYRIDALLVHVAELLPDGVTLRTIGVQPPLNAAGGRARAGSQDAEVPEELKNTLRLQMAGAARSSGELDRFRQALYDSPLFDAVVQVEQVQELGLTFTITARLPASDQRLGDEEGGG